MIDQVASITEDQRRNLGIGRRKESMVMTDFQCSVEVTIYITDSGRSNNKAHGALLHEHIGLSRTLAQSAHSNPSQRCGQSKRIGIH